MSDMGLRSWTGGLVKLAAAALVVPTVLAIGGPAQAETNPSCGSVTQIGTTEHIKVGGEIFGSVKQFKGCGKNWGYVYVWEPWREEHSEWRVCAEVQVRVTQGPGIPYYDPRGRKCASNQVAVWSAGTDTFQNCTRAAGYLQGAEEEVAVTSPRC
jgi:hypothetical protein